ncbi:MAG: murein biosynthesis integral membrane protein MurJ, partial [Acidimicrobiales bacterium]
CAEPGINVTDPVSPSVATGVTSTSSRSARLARASFGTGIGTVASRLTGLARLVVLAYALGGLRLADSFNLANNTPNMIHDLVLGGVLAATFVPVFVERLTTRPEREANESISAVVSLALVILVVATVVFVLLAPVLITLFTFGKATPEEHSVAVELLRLFAPQLLFYGAISLMAAVLATRDRFGAVGFVPVVNNVIGIIVFALFATTARHASVDYVSHHQELVYLLGVGTTVGVAAQAVCLLPSLRRARTRLRFIWRPKDPAVRTIVSLSGWTFGFVIANQLALFIVLALEFHVGTGAVTAYTYAYTFFQFPFAVVATSIINVASPDLARLSTRHEWRQVGRRFGLATKQVLALILPAMVGYLLLARLAVGLLIEHGQFGQHPANVTAAVLELFALGLPGYCVFFLATRTFQALQDTRTAFVMYVIENGLNVLCAFLLYKPLGVRGLALAYSIAYSAAAVIAVVVLRERLGTVGGRELMRATGRFAVLSGVMAVIVAIVLAIIGTGLGAFGWLRLFVAVAAGGVAYLGSAGLAAMLSSWQTARRRTPPRVHAAKGGSERRPYRH